MDLDSNSDDELLRGFIDESPKTVFHFPEVKDYDPKSDSLADQLKQLNVLCCAMSTSLVRLNERVDDCQKQIKEMYNATQRDTTFEIVDSVLKALGKHLPVDTLHEIKQALDIQTEKQKDLTELLDIVRKTKPLIKTMGKRLETIESRDLRMENYYLREKIPFHFQPHHSSGTASGLLAAINREQTRGTRPNPL